MHSATRQGPHWFTCYAGPLNIHISVQDDQVSHHAWLQHPSTRRAEHSGWVEGGRLQCLTLSTICGMHKLTHTLVHGC